jgi:hypothetical protein
MSLPKTDRRGWEMFVMVALLALATVATLAVLYHTSQL